MLQSIEFRNFKGQTGVQPLTGRDIFIGRNGAGKTTRRQAIGLAMLGYIPGEGKTAADTYKFATGDSMTVGMKTDTFQLSRTFTREIKTNNKTGESTPSIKETLFVAPGRGEKTETSKRDRVTTEVGNFPVMMNFGEFLTLSDAKRRDFIYSLSTINSEKWDKELVNLHLDNRLLTLELKSNNPDQYGAMDDLLNKVISQYPDNYSVSDGLQAMLDWVTAEKKYWDNKKEDAQGAVRQFADMKNELDETDRNIAALNEELESLRNQLIQAEKAITADEQKVKVHKKRQDRMAELQNLIVDAEQTPIIDVVEIETKLAEELAKIKVMPDTAQEMASFSARKAEIKESNKSLQDQRQKLSNELAMITSTVKALEEAIEVTGKLGGRCVIHQMIGCQKDFSGLGDFVAKTKESTESKTSGLKDQIDELTKQITVLEQETDGIDKQINAINEQVQQVNRDNAAINTTVAALYLQKTQAVSTNTDRINKLKLYQDELAKLQSEPVDPVTGTELLQVQVVGLRNKIAETEKTVKEKGDAKQAVLMLQQSVLENKKAQHNSTCLKLIQEALGPKGIQGELVKEILEPIRSDIQGNLSLMGFDYEPFFQTESDTGKEIFQFGWINEKGHRVNFDALSNGQQTVYLAAMMVTIIDRAQPKLRVLIIDDLNHLDRINFQMLIDGLSKIVYKLDNVILSGAIEFPFIAEEWNVTNLSPDIVQESKAFVKELREIVESEVQQIA